MPPRAAKVDLLLHNANLIRDLFDYMKEFLSGSVTMKIDKDGIVICEKTSGSVGQVIITWSKNSFAKFFVRGNQSICINVERMASILHMCHRQCFVRIKVVHEDMEIRFESENEPTDIYTLKLDDPSDEDVAVVVPDPAALTNKISMPAAEWEKQMASFKDLGTEILLTFEEDDEETGADARCTLECFTERGNTVMEYKTTDIEKDNYALVSVEKSGSSEFNSTFLHGFKGQRLSRRVEIQWSEHAPLQVTFVMDKTKPGETLGKIQYQVAPKVSDF